MKHLDPRRRARLLSLVVAASAAALVGCAPPDGEAVGAARQAVTICPAKKTLQGLDVSHYDGEIDWAKVKGSGRVFAIAKASEGETFVDPKFADNWKAMKAAGLARGAYHYFHANDDPVAQAEHFLKTMGPLEPGDLPPSLDLEVDDGETPEKVTSTTIAWLDHVAAATKTKPIVYTSTRFVNESMGGDPTGLDEHATLWVAKWGVDCPDVPTPFTSFSFWQTGPGNVPGETAEPADIDVFNGTAADLAAFVVQPPDSGGGGGASASSSAANGGASASGGSGGSGGTVAARPASSEDSGSCSWSATSDGAPWMSAWALLGLVALARRRR